MDSLNPQPRPSAKPAAVVEAPTLKDALRQVRQRYGEDARVIRSRTLTRRQPDGFGQEKMVEVLVEPAGESRRPRSLNLKPSAEAAHPWQNLAGEIASEVERIEDLVQQISKEQAVRGTSATSQRNRLAQALVEAGAAPDTVTRLNERCCAETSSRPDDQGAFLDYLSRHLSTGRGDWRDMGGTHVFLGPSGSGRTELLLSIAASLTSSQRQVLVLSLLPRHSGEVRRLQAEAAKHGYDAAVIQKPRQLASAQEHLDSYDVVLVDAPGFDTPLEAGTEALCREIVSNPGFHRHLVFPMDRDVLDADGVLEQARAWNCDWLAMTRLDQTRRRAKILDLIDRLGLPVSMTGDLKGLQGEPHLASPRLLLDIMLSGVRHHARAEG